MKFSYTRTSLGHLLTIIWMVSILRYLTNIPNVCAMEKGDSNEPANQVTTNPTNPPVNLRSSQETQDQAMSSEIEKGAAESESGKKEVESSQEKPEGYDSDKTVEFEGHSDSESEKEIDTSNTDETKGNVIESEGTYKQETGPEPSTPSLEQSEKQGTVEGGETRPTEVQTEPQISLPGQEEGKSRIDKERDQEVDLENIEAGEGPSGLAQVGASGIEERIPNGPLEDISHSGLRRLREAVKRVTTLESCRIPSFYLNSNVEVDRDNNIPSSLEHVSTYVEDDMPLKHMSKMAEEQRNMSDRMFKEMGYDVPEGLVRGSKDDDDGIVGEMEDENLDEEEDETEEGYTEEYTRQLNEEIKQVLDEKIRELLESKGETSVELGGDLMKELEEEFREMREKLRKGDGEERQEEERLVEDKDKTDGETKVKKEEHTENQQEKEEIEYGEEAKENIQEEQEEEQGAVGFDIKKQKVHGNDRNNIIDAPEFMMEMIFGEEIRQMKAPAILVNVWPMEARSREKVSRVLNMELVDSSKLMGLYYKMEVNVDDNNDNEKDNNPRSDRDKEKKDNNTTEEDNTEDREEEHKVESNKQTITILINKLAGDEVMRVRGKRIKFINERRPNELVRMEKREDEEDEVTGGTKDKKQKQTIEQRAYETKEKKLRDQVNRIRKLSVFEFPKSYIPLLNSRDVVINEEEEIEYGEEAKENIQEEDRGKQDEEDRRKGAIMKKPRVIGVIRKDKSKDNEDKIQKTGKQIIKRKTELENIEEVIDNIRKQIKEMREEIIREKEINEIERRLRRKDREDERYYREGRRRSRSIEGRSRIDKEKENKQLLREEQNKQNQGYIIEKEESKQDKIQKQIIEEEKQEEEKSRVEEQLLGQESKEQTSSEENSDISSTVSSRGVGILMGEFSEEEWMGLDKEDNIDIDIGMEDVELGNMGIKWVEEGVEIEDDDDISGILFLGL